MYVCACVWNLSEKQTFRDRHCNVRALTYTRVSANVIQSKANTCVRMCASLFLGAHADATTYRYLCCTFN